MLSRLITSLTGRAISGDAQWSGRKPSLGGVHELRHASEAPWKRVTMRYDPFGDVPPDKEPARHLVAPDDTRRPLRGHRVAPIFQRHSAVIHKAPDPLPASWFCNEFIVTTPARDIIERLEPGRHQFVPLMLRDAKNRPIETEAWTFFPIGIIETVLPELSEIHPERGNHGRYQPTTGDADVVFRAEAVAGHHCWIERDFFSLMPIVSDAFRRAFDDAGLQVPWTYRTQYLV